MVKWKQACFMDDRATAETTDNIRKRNTEWWKDRD